MSRTAILGSGSFGTTLALLLARGGGQTAMYCRQSAIAVDVNHKHRNPAYFPELRLPENIQASHRLAEVLAGSDTLYLAIPCKYLKEELEEHREALQEWLAAAERVVCNCSKGLLLEPTQRTDAWLAALLRQQAGPSGPAALVHLSGPNLAAEIVAGSPAAAVAAAAPEQLWAAQQVQAELMSERFRVYTGTDPVGVEVAGFYKNVMAIAAGAVHGLELGSNSYAALLTRGLAEMGRLVHYFGGSPATLLGLAGVGDLVATCGSPLSRNFQVGLRRAQGESTEAILDSMQQVAEGVQTSRALHEWAAGGPPAAEAGAAWPELPIAAEVYSILYEAASPRESILRLMRRPPRGE